MEEVGVAVYHTFILQVAEVIRAAFQQVIAQSLDGNLEYLARRRDVGSTGSKETGDYDTFEVHSQVNSGSALSRFLPKAFHGSNVSK